MAYTPTVWASGDKVTSAKLNKLENAVKDVTDTANAAAVAADIIKSVTITVSDGTETFNVKAKALFDALKAGTVYTLKTVDTATFINNGIFAKYDTATGYQFYVHEWDVEAGMITKAYSAAGDDDYPTFSSEG